MIFKKIINHFLSPPIGLRVLMYHKFSDGETDYLTVNAQQFDEQLAFLKNENYDFVKLSDVLKHIETGVKLPKNALLLTFDDAYVSQKTIAEPILKKYDATGAMFIPSAFVGNESNWDDNPAPLLSVAELKKLDPSVWELALHSHSHFNFKTAPLEVILSDVYANMYFFKDKKLTLTPALAYPYGGYPKSGKNSLEMMEGFDNWSIKAAFRIGNRINPYPLSKKYEIQRIDVRGTESFEDFIFKVRFGKLF
jgi:peptidoglycan/xylan/chitin deacetylase (PgdA/CDA1 family)